MEGGRDRGSEDGKGSEGMRKGGSEEGGERVVE